jgi:hypothetical protein
MSVLLHWNRRPSKLGAVKSVDSHVRCIGHIKDRKLMWLVGHCTKDGDGCMWKKLSIEEMNSMERSAASNSAE